MDQSQFFFQRYLGKSAIPPAGPLVAVAKARIIQGNVGMNLSLTVVLANHISLSCGRDHIMTT